MKRRSLILFCFAPVFVFSQNPQAFFTRFGGQGEDIGNAVIQLLNGGYAVAGVTNGFSALQTDVYLGITDKNGFPLAQKNLGGFLTDVAAGITVMNDSSIVLAGYTNSFGSGGYDAYMVKLSQTGDLIWQKTFGGPDWDFANSIHPTADGNLIISGSTYSFKRGMEDAFTLKMNGNGQVLWYKVWGGSRNDALNEVIATNDGGYIGVGTTSSYGDTLGDIWITRFDANGDSLWFLSAGGAKADRGKSICTSANGDFFVAGGSESYTNGREDAYLFKLAKNKSIVWAKNFGLSAEDERVHRVISARAQNGAVAFCYTTRELKGFGRDPKMLLLDSSGVYAGGGYLGTDKDDEVFGAAGTNDKGFVFAGYTKGFNGKLVKDADIYLIRFDSVMNPGSYIVGLAPGALETDGKGPLLYPNPFTHRLSVPRPYQAGLQGVELLDARGVCVWAATCGQSLIEELETGNLNKGFYMARMVWNNRVYYQKLVRDE